MNLFRRLFSQPEANKNDQAITEPVKKVQETAEAAPAGSMSGVTAQLPPDPPRFNIADGVTRPLPQEPMLVPSGHEHITFGQVSDVGMVRNNNQDAALSFFSTGR